MERMVKSGCTAMYRLVQDLHGLRRVPPSVGRHGTSLPGLSNQRMSNNPSDRLPSRNL